MLAGRIPTEIGLLSQLTLLDASENQLPGAWRGLFTRGTVCRSIIALAGPFHKKNSLASNGRNGPMIIVLSDGCRKNVMSDGIRVNHRLTNVQSNILQVKFRPSWGAAVL